VAHSRFAERKQATARCTGAGRPSGRGSIPAPNTNASGRSFTRIHGLTKQALGTRGRGAFKGSGDARDLGNP